MNWTTTLGNLSSSTSITNASGVAEITLSGTVAGIANVSASSDIGGVKSTSIQLQADLSTAMLSTITANQLSSFDTAEASNAVPVNLFAQITDMNGNLLGAGININWSTASYSVFNNNTYDQTAISQTDSSGRATIPLYILAPGLQTVIAEYNGIQKTIVITGLARPIKATELNYNVFSLNVNAPRDIQIKLNDYIGPVGF